MASTAPVILEVALNGVTSRERNPAAPRLPAEVAEDALRCLAAGAAIVHTHTHDALKPVATGTCPQCQEAKAPHQVCPHCGYYRGQQSVAVKEE